MVRRVCNARSIKKELTEEKNSPTTRNPITPNTNKSETQSSKRKRVKSESVEKLKLEGDVSSPALVQAQLVQSSLGTQSASFVKLMCNSDVEAKHPRMRLPASFCGSHLPKDELVTLEDENGENFEVRFESQFRRLSTGWKTFVGSHILRKRDAVIFHLIEPTKFKVYITRDDEQLNVNPGLSEQNGQESSDLSNQFQELGTFEDSESKRVKSHSVEKVKLERDVSSPAMVQAHLVQSSLGTQSPSFVKLMYNSDVEAKHPRMRLPSSFCESHLPKDELITLEDENGENFEVRFTSQFRRLSAGWKTFVVSHKLRERDALIFHLVEPTKFKVYITRDDEQLNVNPGLSEQNGQESSDLSNQFQELRTFEDSESKQVNLPSAGKINLERKQNSPATIHTNPVQLPESPSFIKTVGDSKNIFPPRTFCTLHLPKRDCMITLEDENGNQFEVKYFQTWMGFGVGWTAFLEAHDLHKGDVLHFHLVDPKKFKVYITRVDDQQHQVTDNPSLVQQTEQVTGGSESSDNPTEESIDLGTFTEFQLKIQSLCLESELNDDTLKKYYELCCSKNDILHNKTLKSMNSKLLAVIIGETVNIAGEMKTSDIFTPKEKLEQWENSLKSFKLLGMKVEFLLDRVSQLLQLRLKYEGTQSAAKLKNLKDKREKLKEAYQKIGVEIENLKSSAKMHKVEYEQVIDSPW